MFIILMIAGSFFMLLILMACYFLITCIKKALPFPIIQKIWAFLLFIHPLVLFYPIHHISVQILLSDLNQERHSIGTQNIQAASIAIICVNIFWSLCGTFLMIINIKTKNILSSKTHAISVIDLFLKLIAPFLYLSNFSELSYITLLTINLVCCLVKDWTLIRLLPYYRIFALKLAGFFHGLLTSFAIATLLARILNYTGLKEEQYLVFFAWLLLCPLLMKLFNQRINAQLLRILFHLNKVKNPYYLVHYLEIYKSFSEHAVLNEVSKKINRRTLHYKVAFVQSKYSTSSLSHNELQDWQLLKYKSVKKYLLLKVIELLEEYLHKYPDSEIAKATLACYYIKIPQHFILSEQIMHQRKFYSIGLRGAFCLIKTLMIQNLILERSKKRNDSSLNIENYLKILETFSQIKSQIQEQLKIQISFWKALQSENLKFSFLINQATKIFKKSQYIENILIQNHFFSGTNIYQPLLVLSLYFYLIQNEVVQGRKLFSEYYRITLETSKKNSTTKSFYTNTLSSEALFFSISASSNAFGKIMNCYGPVKKFFEIDKDFLIGKSINYLMHPLYAKYHDLFLREMFQNKEKRIPHASEETNILLSNGQVILCKIKLQLNYLPNDGICYCALLSPMLDDDRRIIILRDNGIIASFSKNFAKDMNIGIVLDNSIKIYDFSPDFHEDNVGYRKDFAERSSSIIDPPSPQKVFKNEFIIREETENQNEHKYEDDDEKITLPSQKGFIMSFAPLVKTSSRKELEVAMRSRRKIVYKAQILRQTTKDVHIIELRMERIGSFEQIRTVQSIKYGLNGESSKLQNQTYSQDHDFVSTLNSLHMQSGNFPKVFRETRLENKERSGFATLNDFRFTKKGTKENKKTSVIFKETDYEKSFKELREREGSPPVKNNPKVNESLTEIDLGEIFKFKNFEMNLLEKHFGDGIEEMEGSPIHLEKAVKIHKNIRKILRSRMSEKLTIYFNWFFVITILCLICFLVWLNIKTSDTSKEVRNRDQVLQDAYFTAYETKLANQETRLWAAAKQGIIDQGVDSFVGTMNKSYLMLNRYNQNLQVSLANLEPHIQEAFYVKNIRVIQRNTDRSIDFGDTTNTFQLISKIIDYGIKNVYKPIPEEIEDFPDEETQFIFDNSFSELLITSENLIALISESVIKTLQESQTTMLIVLLCTLFVTSVFILFSLCYVARINKEFRNLKYILFTLPSSEINQTKLFLMRFNELLSEDYKDYEVLKALDLIQKFKNVKAKSSKQLEEDKKQPYRRKASKVSMMNVYLKNYLMFFGILALFVLQIGFMLIYYNQASSEISIMKKHHTSMETALDYLNTLALTSVEAQVIIMDNGTSTIRNIPVFDAINENINKFNRISELQQKLKKDETNSIYEDQIFFNFSCKNVYSPLYSIPEDVVYSECSNYSYGLGYLGLVNVLSGLPIELTHFITDFQESSRDKDAMTAAYNTYFEPSLSFIDLASTLLLLLFVYTTEDFGVLVGQLEEQSFVLGWLAFFVSILLGSIIWIFLVRNLSKRQFERKLVMSIMPNRLILKNSALRKLLKKFQAEMYD